MHPVVAVGHQADSCGQFLLFLRQQSKYASAVEQQFDLKVGCHADRKTDLGCR